MSDYNVIITEKDWNVNTEKLLRSTEKYPLS